MLPAWFPDTITPDLDRGLHYTLLWGLEGVVLREVGRGQRVPDVNEPRLAHRLEESEVEPVAAAPDLFEGAPEQRAMWLNDLERLREMAPFCRRLGVARVLVGALPGGDEALAADVLRRAGDVAARSGLTLAVRNGGDGRADAEALAALLGRVDHPAVRAAWDPAEALAAGAPADCGAEELLPRLALLIVRDGHAQDGGWQRAEPGQGAVGWAGLLERIARAGFDGPAVLDLTGATPKGGLREATAFLRLLRSARRAAQAG